ncbi:MAG TPA: T9SS type A sorting domain-containing protein [Ignavibacteria bacterium]|nr:T9SS type A sorting domain-containing protein [Ignavibacteria bacterium]
MKIKLFVLFMLSIIFASDVYSQFPNYRIHPSANHQIEPAIVRHPSNPLIMFASSFTVNFSFRSEGVYVTTDGGLSWRGSDTCTGSPIVNHGGDPGPIIDKDGRFILTHQGGFILGMWSNYSTDQGQTWSNNLLIAGNDQDKGSPATDDVSNSPYYGRTSLVWTRFTNPYPIALSYTANGGVNWSPVIQVNNSISGHQSLGPAMVIGNGGKAFVSWAASILTSPFNEDYIGFGVSTNGGDSWTVNETAYDCNGIKSSSLAPWGIRVNGYPGMDIDKSGGPRDNWIYIVTAEKNLSPAGSDPDIVFHRTTDEGVTWSPGIRVNQDPLNNGKIQILPAIRVDENGGINVIYFDNRNISSDSAQIYLSRSTDGGNSWADYLVSDHRFRPKGISGAGSGNQGDNIGITSGNNKLYPVWMDDHTGIYQVWSAIIDLNSVGVKQISSEIPDGFELKQNYPNPFNPVTVISYQLKVNSFINLKVFDARGKETITLVNEKQNAGIYKVDFNGENLPSGVYLYKLETGDFKDTKRMVLLK